MCEIHTTNVEWRPQYLPTVDRGDSSDTDDSRSRSPAPQKIALQVFDTCAREKHARLRPLTYFDVDVYIVAFSVADPASMEHVASLWLPELQKLARKRMKGGARETLCSVVLVGLRTEARQNSLFGEATEQAGRAFAEKLGIPGLRRGCSGRGRHRRVSGRGGDVHEEPQGGELRANVRGDVERAK